MAVCLHKVPLCHMKLGGRATHITPCALLSAFSLLGVSCLQMVRVLDVISDYLRLRGYPHQRLDGSTPAAARHAGVVCRPTT